MHQAEFEQHVGPKNVCPHIAAALERAKVVHSDLSQRVSQLTDLQERAVVYRN